MPDDVLAGGPETAPVESTPAPSPQDSAVAKMDQLADDRPDLGERMEQSSGVPRQRKPRAKPDSYIDDALRSRAAPFNFGDDELKAFGSRHAVERYLELAENAAVMYRDYEQLKQQSQRAAPVDEPAKPKAAEPMKFPVEQWLKENGLDPAETELALLKTMSRLGEEMTGQFSKQLQELRDSVKPIQESFSTSQQERRAAAQAEYRRSFEAAVKGLGGEWEDVFGKGDTGLLPVFSAQRRSRDRLDGAIARVVQGYASAGQRLPPDDEIARQALYGEFRKEVEERMYAGLAKRSREAAASFTNRPGPRPATPDARRPTTDAERKARDLERMDEVLRRKQHANA